MLYLFLHTLILSLSYPLQSIFHNNLLHNAYNHKNIQPNYTTIYGSKQLPCTTFFIVPTLFLLSISALSSHSASHTDIIHSFPNSFSISSNICSIRFICFSLNSFFPKKEVNKLVKEDCSKLLFNLCLITACSYSNFVTLG